MRFIVVVLVVCLVPVAAQVSRPRGIHISPTTVTVAAGETSASFVVRNESATSTSFAVSAFGWRNSPSHEMQLTLTDDIVIYPQRLDVAPGETRRVRVGTRVKADGVERSYRISLDEVSPPQAVPGGIAMRMKYSLPMFVQPRSRKASVALEVLAVEAGQFSVRLANTGPLHVTPRQVALTARERLGNLLWRKELPIWYLLQGESRVYRERIPAADCLRTAAVAAEATFLEGAGLTVRTSQPIGRGACGAN